MYECSYRSSTEIGRMLSNLYPHKFEFQGRQYGSMEGFLQSLKFKDPSCKNEIAKLHGMVAFKLGQAGNDWKKAQLLYADEAVDRHSQGYQNLLTEAYDTLSEQNEKFTKALLDTGTEKLYHNGKHNTHDTVLTVSEYIYQLYRLRSEYA